jgi:branched-chain amino acid transport system ATP-binding protein
MAELLALDGLTSGYGEARVLSGVSLALAEGESLALLGRNGMGKTTLLCSIIGVTRRFAGSLRFGGRDITRLPPEARAALGIGWVPQERNVFRSLTVEENLTSTARPGPWTLARVFELFPRLQDRRRNLGTWLSGGEQQMLAIARALLLNPRLLLLDEPLEGLAPILAKEVLAAVRRVVREEGLAAVIVEQNAHKILAMTGRAAILERGTIVHQAPSAALASDRVVLERYLAVKTR